MHFSQDDGAQACPYSGGIPMRSHLNPCPALGRTQLEIMLGSIAIISRLFVSCRV